MENVARYIAVFPWVGSTVVRRQLLHSQLSLPLGYLLPETRIAKGLELIGNYWYSLL